jgi:hypothetical protein
MMLARKWDRLENIVQESGYDIFKSISDFPLGQDGSALAELRDLRQYLLLVEAEMIAQRNIEQAKTTQGDNAEPSYPGTPADGGHHEKKIISRIIYDGAESKPPWPSVEVLVPTGISEFRTLYIIDRSCYSVEELRSSGILPLHLELNAKELEEMPRFLVPLYERDEKRICYRLKLIYSIHWTK